VRTTLVIAMTTLGLLEVGCDRQVGSGDAGTLTQKPPVVYVVNYPLQYFAQRIAGDRAQIRFPAPADRDPASWLPAADRIAEFQSADLVVLNGAGYAKWVDTASLPVSKVVNTSDSFGDAFIEATGTLTHSHGPTGVYAHAGTAVTTWIDFQQAAAQAQAIGDALSAIRPGDTAFFDANLGTLRRDLLALDARMRAVAGRIGDTPLVASQPVYQYWARRYGLNVRAVTWQPGVVPSAHALEDLQDILVEHPARLMIWDGEPDARSVEVLASIGLASVVFDPCGNVPQGGDLLTVMQRNLRDIERVGASP
jgi:zinc transport system substrate-binding protein